MKLRFFGTILLALIATAVAISTVHFSFFRDERLRLIDYQIENIASILISSNLSADQLADFERADDIVHAVFGDDRLNSLVVIYNSQGTAVYKSDNARMLPPRISWKTQWQTLQYRNHFIRLLTLPWRDRGLILQVGQVMDEDLIRWRAASRTLISYSVLIIAIIFGVSVLLTRLLLKPMKALSEYLQFLTERFDRGLLSEGILEEKTLPEPGGWFLSEKDEFVQLTRGVKELAKKLRASVQLTQRGTAQLAHELKTPLTIIRNYLETGMAAPAEQRLRHFEGALAELDSMNGVVEEFLLWARTENLPQSAFDVHAVNLEIEIRTAVERFSKIHPGRLKVGRSDSTQIFARLSFVQQVLNNLLSNALKYSPADEAVEINLSEGILSIRDSGPGLSSKVIEKLGEPFNSSEVLGSRGSGLGLAWVTTICRKYGWTLKLKNCDPGLMVTVDFSTASLSNDSSKDD